MFVHLTRWLLTRLILASSLLITACEPALQHYVISGPTMGTQYHVTVVAKQPPDDTLTVKLAQRLEAINQQMSTYRSDTEISRFNRAATTDFLPVSKDFAEVLQRSFEFFKQTGGAFNPALKPLIDRWGFGETTTIDQLPPEHEIRALLQHTDFLQMELNDNQLHKLDPYLQIDLSAIAKGYAVDVLSDSLIQAGYQHHLVEIGGEVRARGQRFDGAPWKVAIQRPDNPSATVQQVVTLKHQAIATSGDYRNFVEIGGKRYAHVIDPVTGYPPNNNIASVSVITPLCIEADALATALMIWDLDQGLAFAEQQDLAVFYILRNSTGFSSRASSAFQKLSETRS